VKCGKFRPREIERPQSRRFKRHLGCNVKKFAVVQHTENSTSNRVGVVVDVGKQSWHRGQSRENNDEKRQHSKQRRKRSGHRLYESSLTISSRCRNQAAQSERCFQYNMPWDVFGQVQHTEKATSNRVSITPEKLCDVFCTILHRKLSEFSLIFHRFMVKIEIAQCSTVDGQP
jgi:hypothetical protein